TAIVQVTDLGVHARIGVEQGVVWVSGVSDGRPRAGARVTLYDGRGRPRATATTDAEGLARLTGLKPDTAAASEERRYYGGFDGYVGAALGTDRALVPVSAYDADLSPWRFHVSSASGARGAGSTSTARVIAWPSTGPPSFSWMSHPTRRRASWVIPCGPRSRLAICLGRRWPARP